jgi:hypothetical protein
MRLTTSGSRRLWACATRAAVPAPRRQGQRSRGLYCGGGARPLAACCWLMMPMQPAAAGSRSDGHRLPTAAGFCDGCRLLQANSAQGPSIIRLL